MWAEKYIGLPYKENGRDEKGIDCFGLLKLVYKNELGIILPEYPSFYKKGDKNKKDKLQNLDNLTHQALEGWVRVNDPKEFDCVVLKVLGYCLHVGVYLNNDEFLHCLDETDTVIQPFFPFWNRKIEGFYRCPR